MQRAFHSAGLLNTICLPPSNQDHKANSPACVPAKTARQKRETNTEQKRRSGLSCGMGVIPQPTPAPGVLVPRIKVSMVACALVSRCAPPALFPTPLPPYSPLPKQGFGLNCPESSHRHNLNPSSPKRAEMKSLRGEPWNVRMEEIEWMGSPIRSI